MIDPAARGVLDVARGVLAELDLEGVLEKVLESARELTGARYAALGVLSGTGPHLARFITSGVDEETTRSLGSLPTGHGVLGELIRDPVPLRLAELGTHPRSYGFPTGHPAMSTFLGIPLASGGEPFGHLYLTEKRGGLQFTEADEEALVLLAEFAGLAIHHAQRFSGIEARRGALQRTVDAMDATLQIARTLAGETDFAQVLELVAKRARALTGARALVIELLDGDMLWVAAGAGEVPAGLVGQMIGLSDSVAGTALRTRRPQRLDNDLNQTRFAAYGLGHLGMKAAGGLVVPLVLQKRAHGALVAIDRIDDGPDFTTEDERLLESFAATAATAVVTAQADAATPRRKRPTPLSAAGPGGGTEISAPPSRVGVATLDVLTSSFAGALGAESVVYCQSDATASGREVLSAHGLAGGEQGPHGLPRAFIDRAVDADRVFVEALDGPAGARPAIAGTRAKLTHAAAAPVRLADGRLGTLIAAFAGAPTDLDRVRWLMESFAPVAALCVYSPDVLHSLQLSSPRDGLTGCLNYDSTVEELNREINRSTRAALALSVCFIDVDGFKAVNDVYGHLRGNEVLAHLARTLCAAVRSCDTVGRYGGDEFIVILPETDETAARLLAERLRVQLAAEHLPAIGRSLTASIGVAEWAQDTSAAQLLHRADRALLAAKARRAGIITATELRVAEA